MLCYIILINCFDCIVIYNTLDENSRKIYCRLGKKIDCYISHLPRIVLSINSVSKKIEENFQSS